MRISEILNYKVIHPLAPFSLLCENGWSKVMHVIVKQDSFGLVYLQVQYFPTDRNALVHKNQLYKLIGTTLRNLSLSDN